MEKIKWKAGSQFKVEAQVAADTIRELQKTLGKDTITAQELLDDSRDENAPLHSCFEWDDTIAAEKYRLWQARHIIHSLEVVIAKENMPTTSTRLFVNVVPQAPKRQGEFTTIDIALKNKTYREQILSNALIELRSFRRKYAAYEELTGVFNAIDSFGDTLK